jgi:hypothetical protein
MGITKHLIVYGVQIFLKLLFCHLGHFDSLKLGHAKRLMSWVGLNGFQTTETQRKTLQYSHCLILIVMPCS